MKTGKDVARTGAMLGAMGAFDADDAVEEDTLFSVKAYEHKNDNRYAWRLNCEDGSK